ncbi:MAG: HAMP domain-containing protein [Leptolyngbya sp. SIO3F4]|nr:HAMP domain-containing protein [Leptolyngbya sp. SIO3F4]
MTSLEASIQPSHPRGLSIGVKIFGMTTSLLGLIVLVVAISTQRLRRVNEEIINLADYAIPITDRVAQIDVHVLEQELHFERIQTLYEVTSPNLESLELELAGFTNRGEQVERELEAAIALAQTAIQKATLSEYQTEWQQLKPKLELIQTEHQTFQNHATELLQQLKTGDRETVNRLRTQLIEEETNFNQAINEIFLELEAFTVRAAKAGQHHQQIVQTLSLSIAALATLIGLGYATLISLNLMRPVHALKQGTTEIQTGNLNVYLDTSSRDEVGVLAHAFNAIAQELKLKAQLEETFGKYVDPRIVQSLVQDSKNTSTAGNRQVMTVFFAQVKGIEDFLETLTPTEQIHLTNEYLSLMSAPITDNHGVIDKFIGTVIMGFWGPPFTDGESHARLACEAALASVKQLTQLRQRLNQATQQKSIPIQLHIGLSTGLLVVGNMGSHNAKSYTVMGDTVNTASRLQGVSKQYGVSIVINEETQQQVADVMATRELDLIQVVGKEEPTRIYELLGHINHLSTVEQIANADFTRGVQAYRQKDWLQAREYFSKYLDQKANDRPTLMYLERIAHMESNPPDADWNGVWQLTKK